MTLAKLILSVLVLFPIRSAINSSILSSGNEPFGSAAAAAASASASVIETFQELVRQWKEQQLATARKSYSNASTKPNSRVAALFALYQRQEFYDSLVQSSGTLIVIPHVLMEHWMTQIDLHVNLNYLTANGKEPLVFEYGRDRDALSVDKAIIMTQLHSTHEAVVFFDHGSTRPLPPPHFLSMFKIVVTTSRRFEREWKNGSLQEELQNAKSAAQAADNGAANITYERSFRQSNEACSLLKIHWLRMIVDEGHSMAKGRHSNTIQFASWISAERRWAMTGTPTKEGSVAIKQVHGLLRFLKHDFFTPRLDGATTWSKNVEKAWREGHLAAFFRLRSLLGLLMKRHTKLGIIPPPLYHEKIVPMSSTEVTTYNVIVTVVQSNLLLTSMTEDAKQDSLLHPNQRKFALQTMNNVRRVCAGFSRNVTTLTHKNYLETLQLAKYHHGFPESKISVLSSFMHGAEAGNLSCCSCCGMTGLLILVSEMLSLFEGGTASPNKAHLFSCVLTRSWSCRVAWVYFARSAWIARQQIVLCAKKLLTLKIFRDSSPALTQNGWITSRIESRSHTH
jgi:SNF2-related domain